MTTEYSSVVQTEGELTWQRLETRGQWQAAGHPAIGGSGGQDKVRKKTPLTLKHFEDLLRLLPARADSELSWTVDRV